MLILKKILTILLISSNCFADCVNPVKIAVGDVSKCPGYVFSFELETKIRTDLVFKEALIENLIKQSDLQNEIIKTSNQQVDLYKDKLNQAHTNSVLEKALYFGLGVVVTGLTVRLLR